MMMIMMMLRLSEAEEEQEEEQEEQEEEEEEVEGVDEVEEAQQRDSIDGASRVNALIKNTPNWTPVAMSNPRIRSNPSGDILIMTSKQLLSSSMKRTSEPHHLQTLPGVKNLPSTSSSPSNLRSQLANASLDDVDTP